MEIPVQICLIVELFITIVESSLVLRQPAMGTFEDGAFTSYEDGDVPNAFLIGSIFDENSKIVLKAEIEKEYKFYYEQFENRMMKIGIW
jgi:hypothetical protein